MTQTTSTLRQPGAADFGLLLLLALTWGSSFYFIKEAVETLPPLSLAVGRIAIGAAMLLLIARAKGQAMPRDLGLWGRMVFLGIIGNSLPFFLIAWGEQYTPSNLAAILMATIPSFVIVLAHFFTHDEPMTLGKALGCLCGFTGVVALVGVDALKGLGDVVIGQIVILAGAFSYSLYGIHAKRLPQLGSEMLVGTILLAGLIPLIPVWLAIDQPWTLAPDGKAWFSVAWLGLLVDRRRQPAVLPAAAPGGRGLRLVQQLPGAADGPRLGLLPRRRKAELERPGRPGADPDRPRARALAEA